jgi:phosphohistidine phosphatase SixA/8-oxo-dGTP pyrophosphatase MutT (NUDIX family)
VTADEGSTEASPDSTASEANVVRTPASDRREPQASSRAGTSAREVVRAAGGVVIRGDGTERRIAIVHRPKYDDWTLPKGKLHDGETETDAALREVEEETGLRCRLGDDVGTVAYADRDGRPKIVRYWTMTPERGTFTPTSEVDELRWEAPRDAVERLTYAHDRDLVRSVVLAEPRSPVYLVRHAKAGRRNLWERPDEERPLTPRGKKQARRLVERFEGLDIARVVSSPFVRCVQTVEPLARARGVRVETADELAEGVNVERAVDLVRSLDDRPTVLCGHGREIEALIGSFERDGATVEGERGLAKGSVWVLDRMDGRVVGARYLPAP